MSGGPGARDVYGAYKKYEGLFRLAMRMARRFREERNAAREQVRELAARVVELESELERARQEERDSARTAGQLIRLARNNGWMTEEEILALPDEAPRLAAAAGRPRRFQHEPEAVTGTAAPEECDWRATCATCGLPIRWLDTVFNGGFWKHEGPPARDHEPEPAVTGTPTATADGVRPSQTVPCPECGADAGQPCRTVPGGVRRYSHRVRMDAVASTGEQAAPTCVHCGGPIRREGSWSRHYGAFWEHVTDPDLSDHVAEPSPNSGRIAAAAPTTGQAASAEPKQEEQE